MTTPARGVGGGPVFFKMSALSGHSRNKLEGVKNNRKGRGEHNLDGFHVPISAKDKSTSGWFPSGGLI